MFIALSVIIIFLIALCFIGVICFIVIRHYKNRADYYKFQYSELHGKMYEFRVPSDEGCYNEKDG